MSKKKIEILGRFVYITLPPKKESLIQVDENTKEELNRQLLKKMQKLVIWGVGESANPKLKVGQTVLVNPSALSKAQMVPFFENGEEIHRALLQDFDIIHIW